MTNDCFDELVIAAMLHIRTRVEPFKQHIRKHPADAMRVIAVTWEVRKRCPELDPEGEPLPWPTYRRTPSVRLSNLVALSLRRLHRDCRVERFQSGQRRDAPKYRALNLLEAIARASRD